MGTVNTTGQFLRKQRDAEESIRAADARDTATQKCGGTPTGSVKSVACCATGPNAEMAAVVTAATGGGTPSDTP